MDFDKVERFYAQTGIAEFDEDTCVSSKNFDSLLSAYRAACRLASGNVYPKWESAGGPNECAHGIAAGIPCQDCDRLLIQGEQIPVEAMQGRAE